MSLSILIVEDEQCIRDILTELFEGEETHTHAVGSLAEAQRALGQHVYDLIVTDIRLGGRRDGGLQVMAAAGLLSPDATIIALTAYPDEDNRHASLRLGATHFLEKPVDLATIAALAAAHGVPTSITPHIGAAAPASGGGGHEQQQQQQQQQREQQEQRRRAGRGAAVADGDGRRAVRRSS